MWDELTDAQFVEALRAEQAALDAFYVGDSDPLDRDTEDTLDPSMIEVALAEYRSASGS